MYPISLTQYEQECTKTLSDCPLHLYLHNDRTGALYHWHSMNKSVQKHCQIALYVFTCSSFSVDSLLSLGHHECTQCIECVWTQVRGGLLLDMWKDNVFEVSKDPCSQLRKKNISRVYGNFVLYYLKGNNVLHCTKTIKIIFWESY